MIRLLPFPFCTLPSLLVAFGCAAPPAPPPLPDSFQAEAEVEISAGQRFTPSGFVVEEGDIVEVLATGRVTVARSTLLNWDRSVVTCGPEGTYHYDNSLLDERFPFPSGNAGPFPAFTLLARIGPDGAPFAVGRRHVFRCPHGGPIEFGLNDFDFSDNEGSLRVGLRHAGPEALATRLPLDARPVVTGEGEPPRVQDAHVLILFVDGLRYDVLKEMVHEGYLPNLKRIFFDNGADVENCFTISPANTLPATVAFLTGCWPDRTGFFSQIRFDRESGRLDYLLDVSGPVDTARAIDPPWWSAQSVEDGGPRLLSSFLASADKSFASTMLPVVLDFPPDLWFQRMANEIGLFRAEQLKTSLIDRVQTAHAVEQVVKKEHDAMMIWYPSVDTLGHRTRRGLFGASRVALAQLDADLPELEQALADEEITDSTYFVLFADHGSTGGRVILPRTCDLANSFFFAGIRDEDGDGRPDDEGGLGLNVRYLEQDVPIQRTHSDLAKEEFMICATQAYSAGWISLPKGSFDSRDWSAPNTFAELLHYSVDGAMEPVNLPRRLLGIRVDDRIEPGRVSDRPVELVLCPAPPNQVLVLGQAGDAVIERRPRPEGGSRAFEYRYRVVEPIRVGPDGEPLLLDAPPEAPDPLGYRRSPAILELERTQPGWLSAWHDDRAWLEATAKTAYPDFVCALSHHLLDDPRAPAFDPALRFDLFVVAARGWNLGPGSRPPSVHHGSPDRESVHVPFLVAGPGVTPGVRVARSARIIDIMPTILDLLDVEYDPESLDGRPARGIFAAPVDGAEPTDPLPVGSWARADPPIPDTDEQPMAVFHDAEAWHDPHNLATNVAALLVQEIFRLVDRGFDTVVPGPELRPTGHVFDFMANQYDELPDGKLKSRPAELLTALRLRHITIGEFINPTQSLQHFDRAVGVLRWAQEVVRDPFEPLVSRDSYAFLPFDAVLGGAATILDGTKDLLLEGFLRVSNGLVIMVEGSARSVSGLFTDDPPSRYAGANRASKK